MQNNNKPIYCVHCYQKIENHNFKSIFVGNINKLKEDRLGASDVKKIEIFCAQCYNQKRLSEKVIAELKQKFYIAEEKQQVNMTDISNILEKRITLKHLFLYILIWQTGIIWLIFPLIKAWFKAQINSQKSVMENILKEL